MNLKQGIIIAVCVFTHSSSATLIWSEDFPDANGSASNRSITTGTGNMDVTGDVTYAGNAVVITPGSSGSHRIEMETSAGLTAGKFTFDVSRSGTANASLFVQLVDGIERSTGSANQLNFAHTIATQTTT